MKFPPRPFRHLDLPPSAILAAGDFHFGPDDERNDWTPERLDWLEAQVADGLDWVREHDAVTVLTGDVLSGADYGITECMRSKATRRGVGILARLYPIWLVGNHDAGVEKHPDSLLSVFTYAPSATVGAVYCAHGHRWDPACSGRFGFLGVWASKIAGAVGLLSPEAEDRLRAIGGRDGDHDAFRRTALRDLTGGKLGGSALRILCGHSHEKPCQGLAYLNTGLGIRDGFMRAR